MLLMVEKDIKGGTCHAIPWYMKTNNKYIKDYDKNKESSYLMYWDVNNLCEWAMSWKLLVEDFIWARNTSKFNKNFIKRYKEDNNRRYFLAVNVQYAEKLHEIHNDLLFLLERMKIGKVERLL